MSSYKMANSLPQFILASASEARCKILSNAGFRFEIAPADLDEDALKISSEVKDLMPSELALVLAEAKAIDISHRCGDEYVIGADQTMEFHGKTVNKASTLEALHEQLRSMSGQRHYLHSAAAVYKSGEKCFAVEDSAQLTFRDLTNLELDDYLKREGKAVLNCVGGYRLEGRGIHLFEKMEGNYFSILGLPLLPLVRGLRKLGIKAW